MDNNEALDVENCMLKMMVTTVVAAGLFILTSAGSEAQTLKREPRDGMLGCRERVYVDDGKCPKGQVTMVVGGCNLIGPGSMVAGSTRTRSCVPVPSPNYSRLAGGCALKY